MPPSNPMPSITELFSEQGALAARLPGFRHRPQQAAMAAAIHAALKAGEDLICEAGTGTGKTLAYLAPALLLGRKTIISTGARHLQDQLKQKDLPLILAALNLPRTVVALKGRTNYLCLERMHDALQEARQPAEEMAALQQVAAWSAATRGGDLNELHELSEIREHTPLHQQITSTTDNCLGQACAHYENCFVFKNRKAALEADLVITNHHLLLADLALREGGYGEVLPLAEVIIFDEAHQLPELASLYFSQSLGSRQLLELVSDINSADREEAGDMPDLARALAAFEKQIRDFRLIFGHTDRRADWQTLWDTTDLPSAIAELLAALQALLEPLAALKDRGQRLNQCWQRATARYDDIEAYSARLGADSVRWVEIRGHHIYLNQTPISIAETFQQRLASHNACHIFTSATLAVGQDFGHFRQQLGLTNTPARVWDSPFDYPAQTLLYLPTDLPAPNDPRFFERFIERATTLLAFSRGHAFVLFTSHRSLSRAADLLAARLDYPLLVQGQAPRAELLNRFRRTGHAVLLGTNSFWEGVDVKGQALSLVIIEKLPFASPADPVLKARLTHLNEQGGNAFMDYQLPQAALALKQGIGRLIRDNGDRGACAICDKRIVQKTYGERLINALPGMPATQALEDVARFYERIVNSV